MRAAFISDSVRDLLEDLVRFLCNLCFRFSQCKILIYVHPQKITIPALFWTVLVSVDQEYL